MNNYIEYDSLCSRRKEIQYDYDCMIRKIHKLKRHLEEIQYYETKMQRSLEGLTIGLHDKEIDKILHHLELETITFRTKVQELYDIEKERSNEIKMLADKTEYDIKKQWINKGVK